jgi:hypothetical protein
MAGLERNRFRTRETYLEAAQAVLTAHPEISTLGQLAEALGMTFRTQSRRLSELGIDKDELADWKARRLRARSASNAPAPNRWAFGLVITASTLEEAVARFRAEISPSVEIESVQKR